MKVFDGLRNFVSGLGTERDKTAFSHYSNDIMTLDEVAAIYSTSWVARKAIDLIPDDMTREWRIWESDHAEDIYKVEEYFQIRQKVNQALKFERLYGGSLLLVGDGSANPLRPLEPENLPVGGLKYIHLINRHDIRVHTWDEDINSVGFGKPLTYVVKTAFMPVEVEIHRSRFIIFDGIDSPHMYREHNDGFGVPLIKVLRQAVINAESAAQNSSVMLHEATLDVVKIPDLQNYLADPESERRLIERFSLAQRAKGILRTLILGGDEEFDRKQTAFGGLPDIIDTHYKIVAAALDMPVSRFMGQNPGGLNSTGDNEMRNYYDMIRTKQSTDLSATLKRLDDFLLAHLGLYNSEGRNDISVEWKSLWSPTDKERAEVEKLNAEIDEKYINLGIFPPTEFSLAIRDKMIAHSTYPTLDNHVTEQEIKAYEKELEEQAELAKQELQSTSNESETGGNES